MVCRRCKIVVKSELEKLGLHPTTIKLGEIELQEDSIASVQKELFNNLLELGFEVIEDKKSITIEKIKKLIIELIHHHNNELRVNLSQYLSQHLRQDYNTLSHLFSELEHSTIEKYFIAQKIERVKELLLYNELTLSEIAYQLHYSSVAHLSNQFKKVTGYSPTYFKQLKDKNRTQIDDL
jgi:AraC-like DNA-binding protein